MKPPPDYYSAAIRHMLALKAQELAHRRTTTLPHETQALRTQRRLAAHYARRYRLARNPQPPKPPCQAP